jgi:hypothetical protein
VIRGFLLFDAKPPAPKHSARSYFGFPVLAGAFSSLD